MVSILARDGNVATLQGLLGTEEMKSRGSNDDLDVGVELGRGQGREELLARGEGAVHLPVATDEELGGHVE